MENVLKTNVGIDISKDNFYASITVLTCNHKVRHIKDAEFQNSIKDFKKLEKWINEVEFDLKEIHFTMEATGVYYENIANYLYEQKYIVHVVLPNKAKRFIESLDNKSKTDKLDAQALGILGVERELIDWQPTEPVYKQIKELCRERASLIKIRTQFKNQLHASKHSYKPDENGIKRLNNLIITLTESIKEIEDEISCKIKEDNKLKLKIDKITSIPGVGKLTAATVISETDGFKLIENVKQLCSYAGLDVRIRESGKWKGQSKISKRGNSHLRAILYLPALSSIKYCKQHKVFYERIKQSKKKSKIGITAVSRKLLILIYSIWKNDTGYNESYQNENKKINKAA